MQKRLLIFGFSILLISSVMCTGCDFSFDFWNRPPQNYKEWQKKNDPDYVPEKKELFRVNLKRNKKVPQTYEDWLKKNR